MNITINPSEVNTLIITAEKMMYGTVVFKLERHKAGLMESYVAIVDGGDVCGECQVLYDNKSLDSILQHVLTIDYSEQEDEDASYSWAIQLGDANNNQIADIEQRFWGDDGMQSLIACMEKEIGNSEAISALRDLTGF